MLRRLTKPLITDCRYSTLAALNEICRQSREEQQQEEEAVSDLKVEVEAEDDAQRRVVALSEAENRNWGPTA